MNVEKKIHRDAILMDATCPLADYENYWKNWIRGGATVIAPTVNRPPELMYDTMRRLGKWFEKLRKNFDRLMLIERVSDIFEAKKQGKLGLIFHLQGTMPIEMNINHIEIYYRLGVRMIQLTYNVRDFVGDGCQERTDSGLSDFGIEVIEEMNRLGIVVDCAHTGHQTTLEAIKVSDKPVIISHGNAFAVCENSRNLPDKIIKAIAQKGGVIGINGFPGFVAKKKRPTLDDLINHVDYIAQRVGIDHVSLGIDYFEGQAGVAQDDAAVALYEGLVEAGVWDPKDYPPPPWVYPKGIEMPERLPNLTAGLIRRGYSEEEVKKVLGLNLIRVFNEVWV